MLYFAYFKVSHQSFLLHLTQLNFTSGDSLPSHTTTSYWSHPVPMSQSFPDFVAQDAYLGYQFVPSQWQNVQRS